MCFAVMREQFATVQAAVFASETISPGMVAYVKSIPKESIVDLRAKVVVPEIEIKGCS